MSDRSRSWADFEQHRPRLLGLSYRLLGSMSEAEDMVQEAYLRWCAVDHASVRNAAAFLNTVTTRLCMDQLRSARVRRTEYTGDWLPEPVATSPDLDPRMDRESISMALLVVLERLGPTERAVFVLHHVFDYSFAEIAELTGKQEANCRQIFRRAKQHVEQARRRFAPSDEQHRELVSTFLEACSKGELSRIRSLLAADVCLTSDGGGRVQAITRPLRGADAVARFFAHLSNRSPAGVRSEVCEVNGTPTIVIRVDEVANTVLNLVIDEDGRIIEIHAVRNPDKLGRLDAPVVLH